MYLSYPFGCECCMIAVQQTETFAHWLSSLKDRAGRVRILSRLDRKAMGNLGEVKPGGKGIAEIRIDTGTRIPPVFRPPGEHGDSPALRRGQINARPRHLTGQGIGENTGANHERKNSGLRSVGVPR